MTTVPEPTGSPVAGRRFLTIPNVLSALRLASVPVFLWLFLSDRVGAAVILYGAGAFTDFLDGYIARRTNQVSELGKLLDPLADRVYISALALALLAADALPLWLVLAVVARDVLILSLFPMFERWAGGRIEVNMTGKTATAFLLIGLTSLALAEMDFARADEVHLIGLGFTVAGAALYWVAGAMYAREALSRVRARQEEVVRSR